MMKYPILLMIAVLIIGCQSDKKETNIEQPIHVVDAVPAPLPQKAIPITHANERFRNVTVINTGGNNFQVQGEAQIFEANFSWVVEDGHNELRSGHEMTAAGAPEWGKFDFSVDATKDRDNSTLHLILFESSAKDGSRQHELIIPLK